MTPTNPPPPARPGPPRYLNADHARRLRDALEVAVYQIKAELLAGGAEERGLCHEIGIALARAACNHALDPLDVAATTTIGRLELLVAELGARLEQAKIAQAIEGEATPIADELVSEADAVAALAEAGDGPHVPGARCKCRRCR